MKNFKKFTKLLIKYFGKLNDKLIIQHFFHIHIRTLTYKMYSSNFSTLKNIQYLYFPIIQEFRTLTRKSKKKSNWYIQVQFSFYVDMSFGGPTTTGLRVYCPSPLCIIFADLWCCPIIDSIVIIINVFLIIK